MPKLITSIAKKKIEPYLFIMPALILLSILMLYPMLVVLRYSFLDNVITNSNPKFVGLTHYKEILLDSVFRSSVLHTLYFTILSVIFHLLIGLTFALLLNTKINPGIRAILRVFFIFPWLFTPTIIAVIWRLILDPMGVINYILKNFGIISSYIEWFSNEKTALHALTFINIWAGYPFYLVSLLAGLQGVPKELYEASVIDGANNKQQFRFITIPHLIPIMLSLGLLDFIWTMQVFPLVWMATGGGPAHATEMMSTYTYKMTFNEFEFSAASAAAMIILVLSMFISFFYVKKQKMR